MFIPPWTVDPRLLAECLDQLRTALSAPVSAIGSTAVTHDRQQVLQSLREVLGAIDRTDLAAAGAVSSFVTEYRPTAQAKVLAELFDSLRHGWRELVTRRLGVPKLLLVQRLLASASPDILKILGREDDENSHSDLIAWLLQPRKAPTVAIPALKQLTKTFSDAATWHSALDAAPTSTISVRREVLVARELGDDRELCRLDLLVSGPGFVLGIENKVWSAEHGGQTSKYWEWMAPLRCLRAGLIVSPSGLAAGSPAFSPVSYLDLVSALLEGATKQSLGPREEIVLASYLKTLARFILPVEFRAMLEAAAEVES